MLTRKLSFLESLRSNHIPKTKRRSFLEKMDACVPWQEWLELIRPYYYEGKRGRPPVDLQVMLHMYLLQVWFNLSDEGVEEEVYESASMSWFLGIDLVSDRVPDATTLLKFRHLLEKNNLCATMFKHLNELLEQQGLIMRGGTIVDATIISAPSSTKNKNKARDPEMHQTKKGDQWYFGMKSHIGVDAGSGLVHSIENTAANISDVVVASKLIRDDDTVVYGDSGYIGIEKRKEVIENVEMSKVTFRLNKRRSTVKTAWDKRIERQKSAVRSKVEHPFQIIKRCFGYTKVVYRGLAKNANRLFALFASANILMCVRAGRLGCHA